MLLHRSMALSGLILLATATTALADSPASSSAVICTKDGKTMVMPITPQRQAELLASSHAHALDSGIVVLVANGKTYVVDDHVMPSGKPMIASILSDFAPPAGGG